MAQDFSGFKIKDRSGKVARRQSRMPVNGQSMKGLLNERAAKVKREAQENRNAKMMPL